MAPPGGPKDITPPELLMTIPDNGTVNFNGGRVELHFSEYIEERTIEKSISVLPNLMDKPKIIYKGNKIYVDFPDSLIEDQTYIIIINRTLSDEHKVKLEQGVQVAFSTGEQIDQGSISGKVYHDKESCVQLWKLLDFRDDTTFFNRQPDYVIDATDRGVYNFKFLSSGRYKLIAVDKTLSGSPIIPDKMLYGLSWEPILVIQNQDTLHNIDIKIPAHLGAVKMIGAEIIKESWGRIIFSNNIEKFSDDIILNITKGDSSISDFNVFRDPVDNTRLNFILSQSANDYISIETRGIYKGNTAILDSGYIRIKMDTIKDTTYLKIIKPVARDIHDIQSDSASSLKIIFSNPVELNKELGSISLIEDSIPTPIELLYDTPLSLNLLPKTNWKPSSAYSLKFISDGIVSRYGRGIKDSILSINFSTSNYQGFGSLEMKISEKIPEDLIAELRNMEKELLVYRTVVNSNGNFSMKYVSEGNYSLMFFHDMDKNFEYSYGEIDPYHSSEWFYDYPDTIKIRANWEFEINQVQLKVYN